MQTGFGKTLSLAVCLTLCGSAVAQIYQHVDADGVVHFSDTRPAEEDYQVVDKDHLDALTTTVPATPLPDARQQRADDAARAKLRASRRAAARRIRQARAAEAARCERYRSRLEDIQRRLRGGYGIEAGNRLRAQRRELLTLRAREC